MNVLEAIDVTKMFREGPQSVSVLRGASLSLDAGEIVALEGPSGSGKTTFLTILGCLLTPSSGQLEIEGQAVDPARPDPHEHFSARGLRVGHFIDSEGIDRAVGAADEGFHWVTLGWAAP